jgi:predicted DCC family thiol-disulfide oxidoreductase YuxK
MMSQQATVIYDGNCGICTALKLEAERRDRENRLHFVPFQANDMNQVASDISREAASKAVYLLRADGRRFQGARAFFEAMRRLPAPWGWVGALGAFPLLSLLAEPFYRLVARNRAALSRWLRLDVCELGNLEDRQR